MTHNEETEALRALHNTITKGRADNAAALIAHNTRHPQRTPAQQDTEKDN